MALLGNDPFQIETPICSISLYVITQGLVKFPLSGGNHLWVGILVWLMAHKGLFHPKADRVGLGAAGKWRDLLNIPISWVLMML